MENLSESLPEGENSLPDEPKSIPVLAKTEQTRAHKLDREIVEDFKEIQKRFKHAAKNLAEMHRRRLYFAFGFFTFEEYCRKRFGKSRQYIYKIIQAHDFLKFLEDQGVSDEDTDALTERLVREIRALPQYKQVQVAKAVARIKREKGRVATVVDVQAEAAKIDGEGEEHKLQVQQQEVLSGLQKARRGLPRSISYEALTPDFRRRIIVELTGLAEQIHLLIASLKSPTIDERNKKS
jgi:tellurite resistance protein